MNKAKKKMSCYHSLKTISYLIGFPLLAVMVYVSSTHFMNGAAFEKSAWYGVLAIAALWLVVTILQLGFSLFTKNFKARAMFSIFIAVGLVVASALVFDAYAEKKINEVASEYQQYENVDVDSYNYQIQWYDNMTSGKSSLAKKFNSNVDNFIRIYNIGYTSKNYGGDTNTDLSPVTYDAKNDVYLSPNGMYSDGYRFGINQALDILITYNEVQNYYKDLDKDADVELAAAIVALENNNNSEWNTYKQTEEYLAAYGEDGEAYKYMLNEERLNSILSVLGYQLEQGSITGLISVLGNKIPPEYAQLGDLLNENLNVDTIVEAINDMGIFDETITKNDLFEILKGYSYYQSPKTKPIFEFLEDERLKEYAYAKYYATVQGANVGSVLIGENIGCVTMDEGGYPASFGYSLDELYQLRADLSYKPLYYPLFAARRYLYVFAGIIGLSYILAYHFGQKEKEVFDSLDIQKGGK